MAYLVLARKWRPQAFDEIVGQEHVTRALENAIRLDRVAHAFLFTGARGVGKTTAARVLAKALQCEQGPTDKPCGTCAPCTEIAKSSCVDVFEIDGASNRGINEIRELRNGIAYAPQRDRHKIYIIDEVHMLTQEAFNALLKTLEEPPRHVKFIFATTEPQKIPVTILSRCQRYDFKRVPLSQVKTHLDNLLALEKVQIADEGVRMIARESEGSVRDALSLLDRVISFAGEQADAEMVAECLGIADRQWLHDTLSGILAGDTSAALAVVADVHHFGFDIRAFTSDLLKHLRDLIVVKVCGADARTAELSDAEAKSLSGLGANQPLGALQRMFQILLKAADEVASSRHPRLMLEMALIRCSTVRDLQSVPEVLQRLEDLEERLRSGLPAPTLSTQQPNPEARPAPQKTTPAERKRPAKRPQPSPTSKPSPLPRTEAPVTAPEPTRASKPTRPSPPAIVPEPTGPGKVLSAEEWPPFVNSIKESDPLLASMLEHAVLQPGRPDICTLAVQNAFYRSQLESDATCKRLATLAAERLGATRVEIVEGGSSQVTIASDRQERRTKEAMRREEVVREHPVTQAVLSTMGGEIADVQVEEVLDE